MTVFMTDQTQFGKVSKELTTVQIDNLVEAQDTYLRHDFAL
ncbi:MAG: hypothetical protein ACRBB2_06755 [Nitrosopumilus sp.]